MKDEQTVLGSSGGAIKQGGPKVDGDEPRLGTDCDGDIQNRQLNPGWSLVFQNDEPRAVIERIEEGGNITEEWTHGPGYEANLAGSVRYIEGISPMLGKWIKGKFGPTSPSYKHTVDTLTEAPAATVGSYFTMTEKANVVGVVWVNENVEKWWLLKDYAFPGGCDPRLVKQSFTVSNQGAAELFTTNKPIKAFKHAIMKNITTP